MKWKSLLHNGVLLPAEYEPLGIKFRIKNREVSLTPLQEEMIYQWAKKKDTPYVRDRTFQKNFTADFAATFNPKIKMAYRDLDFGDAYALVEREKEAKLALSKEEKKMLAAERKAAREKLKARYGVAVIDGKKVDLGNYMVEPPGIFIGRGKHPLRGKWKPRVSKGDITLNLGGDAPVPPGEWEGIVHENDSVWVAKWTDALTGKAKYIWLADTSDLKQEMDKSKYEKAIVLARRIEQVKMAIFEDMKKKSRIATVCYLIYRTAMRVGDEKDEEEADTVGATTLRKEHVKINRNGIRLDFLGKDSVRWRETIRLDKNEKYFRDNIAALLDDKGKTDEIFDGIKSRDVNRYLSGIVEGVTAKVFRTYLATMSVTEYLAQYDDISKYSPNKKIYHAKMANLQAAIRCNHKRAIPKTFRQSLEKKKESIKKIKSQTPWAKAEAMLSKVKDTKPKTELQKKRRLQRMRKIRKQIKQKKEKHAERIERASLQIKLAESTRDYNLGTSLRNYIDPRVFRAWARKTETQWEKLYTATLQKKFLWVDNDVSWDAVKESLAFPGTADPPASRLSKRTG